MRRTSVILASLAAVALMVVGCSQSQTGSTAAGAAGTPVAGRWSAARAVPGTASSSMAAVEAVSCAPRAECTAAGDTTGVGAATGAFAISERDGTWSSPRQVPGLAALAAAHGSVNVTDISCPASGDCLLTGAYSRSKPGGGMLRGFVAEEENGTWGTATPVPGLLKLGPLQGTATRVSCTSPGNCVVTGTYYTRGTGGTTVSTFVAGESGGSWHSAIAVPGLAALNAGRDAEPGSLACTSPGNCTLAGYYSVTAISHSTGYPNQLAYVASEVNGSWRPAVELPGIAALVKTGMVLIGSVACPSARQCVLDGSYLTSPYGSSDVRGAFMASQSDGRWSPARTVPGMESLTAVACQPPGTCTAGGTDAHVRAAVIDEADGQWGRPVELPGTADLAHNGKKARQSQVVTMACPSAADCVVGGSFQFPEGSQLGQEVFLDAETSGQWTAAHVPSGIVALNAGGDAQLGSLDALYGATNDGLSCSSVANCAAGGFDTPPPGPVQGAFILAETPVHR